MKQEKKGFYYISFVGILFLCLIPLTPIVSYVILLIHTIMKDPEAVGYVVIFVTIPVIIFAAVTIAIVALAYITLRLSLVQKQKQMGIWHIVIGCVNLVLMPIYLLIINFIMEMTLTTAISGIKTDYILLQSGFQPVYLIYTAYSVGPILILIGGIIGLIDYYKTEQKSE